MFELELPWGRQPDLSAQLRPEFGAPAWLFHHRQAPVVLANTLTETVCADGAAAQSTRVDATTGSSLRGPAALVLEDFTAFWFGRFDTVGGLGSGNYAAAFSTDDYLNSSDISSGRDNFLFGPVHSDVGPFIQLNVAGTGDYRTFSLTAGKPVFLAVSRRGTVGSVFVNGELVGSEFAVGSGARVFENLRLGCQRTTNTENNFSSAKHVLAGVMRKAWTPRQHRAVATNPWQIFAPRRFPVPIYSAGGGSFSDSRAEVLAFAESIGVFLLSQASAGDTITLTDSHGSTKATSAIEAESVSLLDASTGGAQHVSSATESQSFSESSDGSKTTPGAQAESMTLTHTDGYSSGYLVSRNESLTFSDAQTVAVAIVAAIADTISLLATPASDTQTANMEEVVALAETNAVSAAYGLEVVESLTVTHASSVVQALNAAIADALSVLDSSSGVTNGGLSGDVSESLALVVDHAGTVSRVAAALESLDLAELLQGDVQTHITGDITEAYALADACGGTVVVLAFGGGESIYLVMDIAAISLPVADSEIIVPAQQFQHLV